ncbi:PAP2 family protein [Thermosulfidibacter takaii ABI70S6]|uniref:PAP2 family protein n=2 Tax=Thermosulfidibacter takaii TaxID=412593 RepID=A0A0S3QSW0_THET7|nr:PAP2 family protein [Thermosulfidibacter takaii ABI70S6]
MRLRIEEAINIAFAFFMTSLILWKRDNINLWYIKAGINLGIVALIIFVSKKNATKGFWYHFRYWYVALAVPVFFMNLKGVIEGVNPTNWDLFLMDIDKKLFFGHYPELLIEKIYNPLLSELLQIAYVSYFFIPIILGVPLYKKDKLAFRIAATSILLTFYLSYTGYFIVPAIGPRFTMTELFTKEIRGIFLTPYLKHILNVLEPTPHDCFPSGHTAVSLLCLLLARKYNTMFKTLLPLVTGLIFATVYHRYHYVIDVIAGIILALFGYWAGEKLFWLWEKKR